MVTMCVCSALCRSVLFALQVAIMGWRQHGSRRTMLRQGKL